MTTASPETPTMLHQQASTFLRPCLFYGLQTPLRPRLFTDLDDVVAAVFSVNGLHRADVKAAKHLGAGVHPLAISGTQRPREQIRRGVE